MYLYIPALQESDHLPISQISDPERAFIPLLNNSTTVKTPVPPTVSPNLNY